MDKSGSSIKDELAEIFIDDYSISVRKDKIDGDSSIAREIVAQDSYQVKKIIERYPELINKQLTVIDIGGHIGCFGILIMKALKNAKLLAFEPLPEAAEIYRYNMREHDSSGRVFVYNKAVSYSHKFLTLCNGFDPKFYTGNVFAAPSEKINKNHHVYGPPIETITLEKALFESGFEAPCYLIKMDCEEGEWDILSHLSTAVASKAMMVLGEWHDHDWRRIIAESNKCFPHLYTSTHIGWGCGNFFAFPKDQNDYFADYLSLNSGNIFAASKVEELSALTTGEKGVDLNHIPPWKKAFEEAKYRNVIDIVDKNNLIRNARYAELLYCYAFSLHATGETQKAIEYYELSLKSGFAEFWVRYNRGSLLLDLGRLEEARVDLMRAHELDPSHKGVQQQLAAAEEKSPKAKSAEAKPQRNMLKKWAEYWRGGGKDG